MDPQKKDEPDELAIGDLDAVVGGSNKMLTLLTQLLQMKHEGLKSVIQNFRA